MFRSLNPLAYLPQRRGEDTQSEKLYGAIVARARLPVFYQEFSIPDTLMGRFAILALHLFAVLHCLKGEGVRAVSLAQNLIDRFSEDMETVLREVGVGDLSIPKKVRKLAASSAALLQDYETAFVQGDDAIVRAIERSLPVEGGAAEAVSRRLAAYLTDLVRDLEGQSFAALNDGQPVFREAPRPLGAAGAKSK